MTRYLLHHLLLVAAALSLFLLMSCRSHGTEPPSTTNPAVPGESASESPAPQPGDQALKPASASPAQRSALPSSANKPKGNVGTAVTHKFKSLIIEDIHIEDRTLYVTGTTDLPDGALIGVEFDVPGREDEDISVSVDARSAAASGKYSIELVLPNIPEYSVARQSLDVSFSPWKQADRVLALVGKGGEHLVGTLLNEKYATRRLVVHKDLTLKIPAPTYPMVKPTNYRKGTAERVFAEFLVAWEERDWRRMVKFTQLTWRYRNGHRATDLEARFLMEHLLGAEILPGGKGNEVRRDLVAKVTYYHPGFRSSGLKVVTKLMDARIIREDGAYSPSTTGTWGVNPLSTMRERDP